MRCMRKNKVGFYYANYVEKQPLYETDEYGNRLETGEDSLVYTNPIPFKANISPASGTTVTELFGSLERYDKVIVIDNPRKCPIDEHSILWIDRSPELEIDSGNSVLEITSGGIIIGDNGRFKPHDYIVKRIAKSLNYVAIAVSKVDVR